MRVQADAVHKQPCSLNIYTLRTFLSVEFVCLIFRHVCTEQKYVHTRNVYTNTRTHTHTLGYVIHNRDPSKTSKTLLHPCTSFTGVCMWFWSFHLFFFRNCCMYWKHPLFLCLFFWLSQLLHQLCHWAPKSAVVDDRSCKKLSIQYLGISVSFKEFHANLIGPKHFVRTASKYYDSC